MKDKINIYEYTDFRQFISDWVKREKELNPKFSYRYFNRQVGINSSSFLPLLISGARNIGEEGILAIIKGFGLSERQGDYFRNLVEYNQADSVADKNNAFVKLNQYSKRAKKMMAAQYNLFSKWYYAAILEILKLDTKKKKDINYILKTIKPSIGRVAVKNAIDDLLHLKLITQEKTGFEASFNMIATPDEFVSMAVCNLHAEMSSLAARSVLNDPADEREFSALTIALSQETYKTAKKKIQQFRKELHQILENEGKGKKDVVCQFNFQQFRLNQKEDEK